MPRVQERLTRAAEAVPAMRARNRGSGGRMPWGCSRSGRWRRGSGTSPESSRRLDPTTMRPSPTSSHRLGPARSSRPSPASKRPPHAASNPAPARSAIRSWSTAMPRRWRRRESRGARIWPGFAFPRRRRGAWRATPQWSRWSTRRTASMLSVGRRTRTIPPHIRRALEERDRGCRFPEMRVQVHRGPSREALGRRGRDQSPGTRVLLSRRHHRPVHEGRVKVSVNGDAIGAVLHAQGEDAGGRARPIGRHRGGPADASVTGPASVPSVHPSAPAEWEDPASPEWEDSAPTRGNGIPCSPMEPHSTPIQRIPRGIEAAAREAVEESMDR